MAIDDKVRDEKREDTKREAASLKFKTLALSSDNIDRYGFLTDWEILPVDQSRVIEQAKFTYSTLGKAFERQTKSIENQSEKQLKSMGNS